MHNITDSVTLWHIGSKKQAPRTSDIPSRFANDATIDLFDGVASKKARKLLPQDLHRAAQRKLIAVAAALSVEDVRTPPGNKLEALAGDREGQYSIRINDQYRICFTMTEKGSTEIEVVDYH